MSTEELDLHGKVIAVIGGDEREQEIARLAAGAGASTKAFGFPFPKGGIAGVELCSDALEAARGAHYLLLPIPGMGTAGEIYAPSCPVPILPDRRLLSVLSSGATIFLGTPNGAIQSLASELGLELVPYESDRELMLLRAPAIVEGAIRAAIENTDVTIHGSQVAVIGHGTIGRVLARTLVQLGAHVTVFARDPVQRADASVSGCRALGLGELGASLSGMAMVISTVPVQIVSREHLANLIPPALVMDLAAPPGGVDLDAAREMGHRAVWARGLGRRAPVTVGASQWHGIAKRIAKREAQRSTYES